MLLIQKRLASTLRVVKTGLLGEFKAFDNVHKHLGKISAKKLKKYNLTIQEESIFDGPKDSVLDATSTYYVGDFNQYPKGAHDNMSKFAKQVTVISPCVNASACLDKFSLILC